MRPLVLAHAAAVFLALFVAVPGASAQALGPYGPGPPAPFYGPQEGADPFGRPLLWDDPCMRRVPSRTLRVLRWHGGGEPGQVAAPAQVLDALATLAGLVASASLRELELLRRLLGSGDAGRRGRVSRGRGDAGSRRGFSLRHPRLWVRPFR